MTSPLEPFLRSGLDRPPSRGLDECCEKPLELIRRGLGALGMALDADDESLSIAFETLDQWPGRAVRPSRCTQAGREFLREDPLVVIGVDLQLLGGPEERGQAGPADDPDRVGHGRAETPAGAVVALDVLEQRAA